MELTRIKGVHRDGHLSRTGAALQNQLVLHAMQAKLHNATPQRAVSRMYPYWETNYATVCGHRCGWSTDRVIIDTADDRGLDAQIENRARQIGQTDSHQGEAAAWLEQTLRLIAARQSEPLARCSQRTFENSPEGLANSVLIQVDPRHALWLMVSPLCLAPSSRGVP